jgi:hypothetical protein
MAGEGGHAIPGAPVTADWMHVPRVHFPAATLVLAATGFVVSTAAFIAAVTLLGCCRRRERRSRMPRTTGFRFRCPVTLEDVSGVCGVTATGHAYNAAAIVRWMAAQSTDPLSGVLVPSSVAAVWLCRFQTEADLADACGRARAASCEASPKLALALVPSHVYIGAVLGRLRGVLRTPAWGAYSTAARAAIAATRAASHVLAPSAKRRLLVARREALVKGGLHAPRVRRFNPACGLVLPPEHMFIGVVVTAANALRRGSVFVDFSFAGANVIGAVRDVEFVRCSWTAAEFAADCCFHSCVFRGGAPPPSRVLRECTVLAPSDRGNRGDDGDAENEHDEDGDGDNWDEDGDGDNWDEDGDGDGDGDVGRGGAEGEAGEALDGGR